MDLFAASGVELGDGGKGGRRGRPTVGTLRVPLLKYKVVAAALKNHTFDLSPAQIESATSYAKTIKSPKFTKMKETSARPLFIEEILQNFLGYQKFNAEGPHTLVHEEQAGSGAVDVALGHFGLSEAKDCLIAPFELKGPVADLDAIMPGRGISPVQQAWNYAVDLPGCRWVLVSNCIEVRLYGFGRGREAYELFDLTKLDDQYEQERLWLLLSAGRLLDGATDALLRETDTAYKTITNDLYRQYTELRQSLVQYLTGSVDGPRLAFSAAIEAAQKILDRILFIAFAERTALLPDKLIERAVKAKNEFRPEPVWRNFLSLFRGVDQGDPDLRIWPFNGGLFKSDAAVDAIELPDALTKDLAKLAEWDYRDDVPVTLLGHLFEQSITDLEALRAESRGEEAPRVSKRKREGVVYTPDIVTRFLVDETIGKTLSECFAAILLKHGKGMPVAGDPIFSDKERDDERAAWRDYVAALRGLRIVDPACGSGAFLVAAFDRLAGEYRRAVEHLAVLGETVDFDPFDEIVTKNLYGIDLNSESVEITRLALWLKTARSQHKLQNLEDNIKTGNSLIDDKAFSDRPFDWRAAFPEVFAGGGFDIVIGNPPYVRMEFIKPVKPYLEKHYVVAADRADLYAYFFERGVGILKDGGRLGYISSSTFFRTGSGENLRTFLGDNTAIETVVDFGDLQLFEGVTTYPAILTLTKEAPVDGGVLRFLTVSGELPQDLGAMFAAKATAMPRARLGSGSWQFEDDQLARLRDKIVSGRKTLGEVYGAPLRGIVTGLNDAFVVDQDAHDRLVKQDKKSEKLLKPFLRGENIKRWRVEPEGLWLINIPKGTISIDDYPAIRDWLLPFKSDLEKRATKQEWFELQQAQLAYQPKFSTEKISYGHFAQERIFAFERKGFFSNDKSYFIPDASLELLTYLNSSIAWLVISGLSPAVRGGFHEMRVQYVQQIPIPDWDKSNRTILSKLGTRCSEAAERQFAIEQAVRRRILDLAPPEHKKLTRKLEEWWTLDFDSFRTEVKRAFRADIPVRERGDWEAYLGAEAGKVKKLDAEIAAAEREIDAIVYRLFDLTPEEIGLLEASI